MEGWIKLHRKIIEKSFYKKDSEAVHLWIHILICANRSNREEILGGKKIICEPGQFTTGRKQLSKDTGINESKIERLLNKFEKNEQQIKQEKTNTNRLISVINWLEYQSGEQVNEQQLNNERTTTEQQLNTLQEVKTLKNKRSIFIKPSIFEISQYCQERKNTVNPNKWLSHYESNGWMVGKSKMKDWKASIRTWEQNQKSDTDSTDRLGYNESYIDGKRMFNRIIEIPAGTRPCPNNLYHWSAQKKDWVFGN